MKPLQAITLYIVSFVFLMTGCTQSIPVFVTPEPTSTIDISSSSTATQSATSSPTTTTNTDAPAPTVTFMGSIIGSDYQPPATTTPIASTPESVETVAIPPTETLTPSPTSEMAGTPMPLIDTTNLGIQTISFVTQEDWNVVMKQVDDDLRLGWIKVQVSWQFFQPNGPDEISEDFRRFEIFIEQIRQQRQVRVLLSVAKAPTWSRSDHSGDGPPDDPQALARFITLMLSEFGDSVDAIEVWNEPNLLREWHGQSLDGGTYMRYFAPSYQAIRAYSPDIIIITAGLAPTSNTDGARNDREYLQEMYNAGLAQYRDVMVGAHPYGWGNPPDARCCAPDDTRGWDEFPQFFFLNTVEDYRNIMVANGHGDTRLWLTELGWATWDGLPGEPPDPWMSYNDKWAQANYNMRAIQIAQSLDYVDVTILWNLNFAQPYLIENRDERAAYSIVLPEGAPRERPFFWMLYDAVRDDVALDRYD